MKCERVVSASDIRQCIVFLTVSLHLSYFLLNLDSGTSSDRKKTGERGDGSGEKVRRKA